MTFADPLWPLVESWAERDDTAGIAVGVVRDGEVVTRGFGVRDVSTGEPVTPETMFHLASVSKPFVATAAARLLDLDSPITRWVPEIPLDAVTVRRLLSHTSGLPDVSDYGWHEPQLGDDALADFARSVAGWRLASEPGSTFAYSNAGYELLGLAVGRAAGTTFEDAVRREVLLPHGLERSTFLRADVPPELAASPHVAMPLVVPGDSYPYNRRHAPSSTLHSNVVELCRFLAGDDLDRTLWEPVIALDDPPWDEHQALGWAVGTIAGERVLSHSGADPGFLARLALVPSRRVGAVVLANSNTVPVSGLARAALEIALGQPATQPPHDDLDPEDAVWGAIELHRTDLVWPFLRDWLEREPESSAAQEMERWARRVDADDAVGGAG